MRVECFADFSCLAGIPPLRELLNIVWIPFGYRLDTVWILFGYRLGLQKKFV